MVVSVRPYRKILDKKHRAHVLKSFSKAERRRQPKATTLPKDCHLVSFFPVVSQESRAMHLNTLVQEAQDRMSELSAQVENEGFTLDNTEKEKQLKAWEWRSRLYRRMKTGFEHASEYARRGWRHVTRLSFA